MTGSGQLSIRPTTAQDDAAVTALLRASYTALLAPNYPPALMETALPLIAAANPRLLASGSYFAAFADDRCVGCGGWTAEAPGGGGAIAGAGHIRHFATHPDLARRGIAQAIMQHCLHDARARGIRQLDCFAALGSEPFYAAQGFRPVETLQVPMPGDIGFPASLMRLSLT